MDKKEILSYVKNDYAKAKNSKVRVDENIASWLKDYNGEPYGNEVTGRSKVVVKDIKKSVDMQSDIIISPFTAANNFIRAKERGAKDKGRADRNSDILNYQYKNEFDYFDFIRQVAAILPQEGTVVIKTGWEYESKKRDEEKISGLSEDEIMQAAQAYVEQGFKTKISKGEKKKLYNLSVWREVVTKNRPTAVICRNESVFIDPACTNISNARFVIHRYKKSLSDIKKQKAVYNTFDAGDSLEITNSRKDSNSSLGEKRDEELLKLGYDRTYEMDSTATKMVSIIEYWGKFDIDGDGIAEDIVIAWVEDTDTVIRYDKNPFPDGEIPFVSCVYKPKPFAAWGNALADSAGDIQKIHTAFMRSYIENVALTANNQLFLLPNTLDPINKQKFLSGERVVEIKNMNGMTFGQYNQIPASVLNLYGMLDSDLGMLTGVNKNAVGDVSATVGRTASGMNTAITSAQAPTKIIVLAIADMYKSIFVKWQKYNEEFLDNEQEFLIAGELSKISKDEIKSDIGYNIEVNVNLEADNQAKLQQINMFLQQAQYLQGMIPPDTVKILVGEMFKAIGEYQNAKAIEDWQQPEPTAEQMMMQQLQIQRMQLDNALVQSEIEINKARAGNATSQSVEKMYKTAKTKEEIKGKMIENEVKGRTVDLDILKKGADVDATTSKFM
jgi:hypothetical protein